MSNTESFESVAKSYDNCTWIGKDRVKAAIDRLKAAHDREIKELRKTYDLALAQARDPQRLRGTKPDTFDGAIEALREFRWQHATNDEDAIPYINGVAKAHAQSLKREYHRGFEDGAHSMDAEHRAVSMRLRQLPRGCRGFSDAHVSWFADLAWAMGIKEPTFAVLRDELVRLMGGVSDENVHVGGLRCIDGCMGDVSNGEDTGRTHDSPSNRDSNHMAVREGVDTAIGDSDGTTEPMTTDELIEYIEEDTRRLKGDATGAGDDSDTCACAGGGACAVDCGGGSWEQEVSDGRCEWLRDGIRSDSLIPVLPRDKKQTEVSDGRVADDCGAAVRCGDSCGDLHMDGVRITDELREWMSTVLTSDDYAWVIADRIDEQFNRVCEQQEAVLQSTVDGMCEEQDRLQAKLDRANGENKGLRLSVIEQKEAIIHRKKTIKKLARDNEKVWKTVHELQAKLNEYDSTHIELPRDANGEVFHLGCTVRMVERHPEVLLTVHSMTLCDYGLWLLYAWDDKNEYSCNLSTESFKVCEPKPDTAESIVRDLSMGTITESEAINRIEALNG